MAGVTVLFDSSVLIAGLLESHVHHRTASAALDSVHRGEIRGFASTHALAETFGILSGLPTLTPVEPGDVLETLRKGVVDHFEIVPLDAEDYMTVFEEMRVRGLRGKVVFDALHVRAARKAGAEEILTLDGRDFRRIAPDIAGRIRAP